MLINAQQINKAIIRHKHNFTTTNNRINTGVINTDNIEWHIYTKNQYARVSARLIWLSVRIGCDIVKIR